GAPRFWPRGPCGGTPPQTAGIALLVPCGEKRGVRAAVPERIASYADGTLRAPSARASPMITGSWSPRVRGEHGLWTVRSATKPRRGPADRSAHALTVSGGDGGILRRAIAGGGGGRGTRKK